MVTGLLRTGPEELGLTEARTVIVGTGAAAPGTTESSIAAKTVIGRARTRTITSFRLGLCDYWSSGFTMSMFVPCARAKMTSTMSDLTPVKGTLTLAVGAGVPY